MRRYHLNGHLRISFITEFIHDRLEGFKLETGLLGRSHPNSPLTLQSKLTTSLHLHSTPFVSPILYFIHVLGCLFVQNLSIVLLLEPGNGLLLVGLVSVTNSSSASLSSGNSGTVSAHDNVEVHTVDTDTWVVLDTQVNVLVNTETEVTGGREVLSLQLELLHSQASLQDLLSLWTSNGDVHRDLFVSSDTESSDGVSGLRLDWGLTRQLLQHLGGSGQSVTGFTDTDVQDQLFDTQLTHRVLSRLAVSNWLTM